MSPAPRRISRCCGAQGAALSLLGYCFMVALCWVPGSSAGQKRHPRSSICQLTMRRRTGRRTTPGPTWTGTRSRAPPISGCSTPASGAPCTRAPPPAGRDYPCRRQLQAAAVRAVHGHPPRAARRDGSEARRLKAGLTGVFRAFLGEYGNWSSKRHREQPQRRAPRQRGGCHRVCVVLLGAHCVSEIRIPDKCAVYMRPLAAAPRRYCSRYATRWW